MTSPASTFPRALPEVSGYTIVEQLYLGCRTAVYRAIRTATQESVVIKMLRSEYPTFGELVQFRNQYTITKNLTIPGIVQPLTLESLGNRYALVMEDWGGIALDQFLQERSLDLLEVLAIALQLADILHDLGQHRIIHKDIKPANILIHLESKQVKLIDFSIASLLPKESQELQNLNGLEGTLAYLAPEQTGQMNRGIDYRVDFYSLGVTLYQLLTGVLPFTSTEPLELIHCHIAKAPAPIDQVNPDIPERVAAIVTKLMAKNAEDRYQSAIGLKHDLSQCFTQWKESGSIRPFELGQRDLSDRFLIPEKLYGRESEVEALLSAFDRVAEGSSELILVSGFSGIGKTAVVNEVHKPIVRQRGYFSKGKFDQFNRNIPLSAFVQALRDLMGQLLSESDEQVQGWKRKILSAVGENGQVLIEVIPELARMIGQQPVAPELSGGEAQSRFNLLFQKFIKVFTTAEHPLVLFLDDLQWADAASLQLLKLLMSDSSYLLVLGAYRDNEVFAAHPFIVTVEELKKAAITVQTIALNSLAFADTNQLVAETLNCTAALAQPLTELIDRKTKGNPFFTAQFLKALYEEGQISFNRARGYWECDIAQVSALSLTDDVVEFMALQLQKLPAETQQVLKLAACMGNQFDLETLAVVSKRSPVNTATALWKVLQEGLVLPISQVYKFFQEGGQTNAQNTANPTYRFLHDRVQQAAYSLIPADQKQSTHLAIAQLLLQNTSEADLEASVFEIVNHWNQARSLLQSESEKNQLAQLNLVAGRKAKASAAPRAALSYFQAGIELLPDHLEQAEHAQTLALYEGAAEAAYACTEFEQMEQYVDTVLSIAKTPLEGIRVYEMRIQAYTTQGRFPEVIAIGRSVLQEFSLELPEVPTGEHVQQALQEVSILLEGQSTEDLLHLPTTDAAETLAVLSTLTSILSASYASNPTLFTLSILEQVKITIQRGNTPFAAIAYSNYLVLLNIVQNDFEAVHQFGQLTLKLQAKFSSGPLQAKVNFIVGLFATPYKFHAREALPLHLSGLQAGLEAGDLEFVGYNALQACQWAYFLEETLAEAAQKNQAYLDLLTKLDQLIIASFIQVYLLSIHALCSQKSQPELEAQAKRLQKTFTDSNDLMGLCYYWIHQLVVTYLLEGGVQANQIAKVARQYLKALAGQAIVQIFCFYDSLAALAVYAHESDPSALLKRVDENQASLQHRAAHAPMNFQHKYDLVAAERCRALAQNYPAMELYDRAIAGAKANGYVQEAALASELAARFYLDWGKEKVAAGYMQEAYYGYAQWGAKAKVQDLENCYPQLLTPILQQPRTALSTTGTLFSSIVATSQVRAQTQTSTSSNTSTSISADLDLATVLKASQALSSEIQLDKLLVSLMTIVVEAAGADNAGLFLRRHQALEVVVKYFDGKVHTTQPLPLTQATRLPISVVQYVDRTGESVILEAANRDRFARDPYLSTHQPASFLCTPIFNRGELIAILHLENSLTARAFTRDRIELLNVICAQAAISLENARLYQQSQAYVQQLEQSQLQVVQSEKMASLGNLVAGVAHEINNPIGFLSGSIKNAGDYMKDLLSYIDLYQQHHPNAALPVQEKAEDIDLEFLEEDLPKLLGSMKGATDRIKGISTSLRTFSRADTDHKISANLHDGIDSTLLILKYRLKANESRPAIEVVQDYGDLPSVQCFPGQLNQVFMNILSNAIDVFDESALQSSFSALQANPNKIIIQTTATQNAVEICFRDNGKGMAEDVKARIFDHLFTTKGVGRGTGLGLAISRQIVVEKHSGSLEVRSEPGRGTEFCIRLSVAG